MVYRRRARRGCEAIVVHRRRARRGCEAIVGTGMAPTQPTLMEPRWLRRDGGHEQGTTKATSPPHDGHDVRPGSIHGDRHGTDDNRTDGTTMLRQHGGHEGV